MFGFVKDVQSSGTGTNLAITVTSVKVGYLVVVSFKFAGNPTNISVTDNASTPNTYALAIGPIARGTDNLYQFYGVAVTGGATTVTVSWTGSVSTRITVDQFSGGMLTNATVFDKAVSNSGTGTSSSVSLSPTNASELVVAAIDFGGGESALAAGTNYLFSNNNLSLASEYRAKATTSETAPFTWTGSASWTEIAGAYIPRNVAGNFFKAAK